MNNSKLEAALLRVSMELRLKKAPNLAAATRSVAHKMRLPEAELSAYLHANFQQLMTVSKTSLIHERAVS